MIKPALFLAALFFPGLSQDVKEATWSIGTPNTDSYESLSFWVKEDHRAYVRYAHGTGETDIELHWLGPDTPGRSFRVSMPQTGECCWVIALDSFGSGLHILDRRTNSNRRFYWEDPNPSGDSVTRCSICAPNGVQAQGLLRRYFMH